MSPGISVCPTATSVDLQPPPPQFLSQEDGTSDTNQLVEILRAYNRFKTFCYETLPGDLTKLAVKPLGETQMQLTRLVNQAIKRQLHAEDEGAKCVSPVEPDPKREAALVAYLQGEAVEAASMAEKEDHVLVSRESISDIDSAAGGEDEDCEDHPEWVLI